MKIAIHLDGSQQYIFYSGQDVSGHVRLETKDEIKIRGIRLEVHGTSHALLIERWGPFRRRYKCTETLMNLKTYITGSDTGSEITLQPGVQTCPLSFVLPNNVPSSFHGAYGFTRYKMKVVVDRINRLNDSTEIPITVIRQLNLNNEPPEMKVPIVVQDERPMAGCCVGFCCIKGLPEIELRMNKGCFVIGETIILSGRVFNRSNTEIRMTSINFIQDTDYHLTCTDGSKLENHEHRNLGTIKRPQVKVGCTDTWSDVTFTVPPVMASRMDGSEIFSINYFIEILRMKITIQLDGNQGNLIYAGQSVRGTVRVELKDEIKMRGIRLEVHGDSRVQWSEGSGRNRRYYSSTETLMDLKTYLVGQDKDSELTLRAGVHTYPLVIVMPIDVPSSFEGTFGYIRYKLRAVVNRIRRLDDTTDFPISVIRVLNINNEPQEVKEPILVTEEEPMVGCCVSCCCIKGLPEIELRMNRAGFVPGETIILSGKLNNKSNANIKKTTINFIQEIEYLVMNSNGKIFRRKLQYKTLDSSKRQKVSSGSTDSWSDVTFTVPRVMESRLDGSSIINITYFIQVKAEFTKCCCAETGIRHDIIIGHIPLQGNPQYSGPITTQPTVFSSPFQYGIAPAVPEQSSHSGVHGGAGWP